MAVPSHGQCNCGGTAPTTNATMTTMAPVTMAPATTMAPANGTMAPTTMAPTTMAPTTMAPDEASPSVGPSTGPQARRLDGHSNATASNATTTPGAMATTTEEECVCAPEVMSTFTATMAFPDPEELVNLDFDNVIATMTDDSWDNTEVVVLIKNSFSLTFAEGTAVTAAECVSAAALAYSVAEDMVTCAAGEAAVASGTADAGNDTASNDTAASRRLQDVVMDVQISYAQSDLAVALAAGSAGVDWGTAGFAATPTASASVATVEMTFTVTASAQIEPPMASDFVAAFLAEDATVTAAVSSVEVTYSIMPCSASTDVCAAGYTLRSNAMELACAGAECSSDDSGTCCTQVANAGAQHTCMLGSLSLLAFSTNLLF